MYNNTCAESRRKVFYLCGCGGIGRRARFRFWWQNRAGSSPVTRSLRSDILRTLFYSVSYAKSGVREAPAVALKNKKTSNDTIKLWFVNSIKIKGGFIIMNKEIKHMHSLLYAELIADRSLTAWALV